MVESEWQIKFFSNMNNCPVRDWLDKLSKDSMAVILKDIGLLKKYGFFLAFVLLNGFTKKTQKTPQKEIDLAVKRMKEIIAGGD